MWQWRRLGDDIASRNVVCFHRRLSQPAAGCGSVAADTTAGDDDTAAADTTDAGCTTAAAARRGRVRWRLSPCRLSQPAAGCCHQAAAAALSPGGLATPHCLVRVARFCHRQIFGDSCLDCVPFDCIGIRPY